ncbi:hypothetical protein IFM89_014920 [Coptis chinensis]|uniref:Uncharacterized protein n=1 Tax=Coptis chinensis TaxID=261450 RepID=A0A835H2Z5_9MAGN|nr:hypothetical protein IFM89_014920 [Coptis chinensis]
MRTPKKHEETPRGLSDISMKGVERLLKNNNNFSQSEEAGPSSSQYTSFPKATEFEWEDGFISTPGSREVVVQFYDDSPSTSKKKTIPRPTVQDKEVAEVVHKVHLLCLIARGRLIDNACDDSLIQAALLSLIPSYLLKRADEPKLTAKALTPLIKWFHDNFKVDCSGCPEKPFELSLASALENRKGSAEEGYLPTPPIDS